MFGFSLDENAIVETNTYFVEEINKLKNFGRTVQNL